MCTGGGLHESTFTEVLEDDFEVLIFTRVFQLCSSERYIVSFEGDIKYEALLKAEIFPTHLKCLDKNQN